MKADQIRISIGLAILFVLGVTSISKALNPKKEYDTTQFKLNLKYEERKVQTSDGASLNVWYFPSPRITNKVLIISHNGDGNMGDNLKRIKSFMSYGFNVVTYDYRGFGKSSDFAISEDIYLYSEFYDDFEAIYDFTLANFGKKIYLYGWGIGATISITQGYVKPNTYSIVADGSLAQFSDMPGKFKKIGSRMTLAGEVVSNYKDPYTVLGTTPTPNFRGIMLMVGSHDYLFTPGDMELLRDQLKTVNHEILVLDNKRQWDNYRNNPSHYLRKVHHFLVNN